MFVEQKGRCAVLLGVEGWREMNPKTKSVQAATADESPEQVVEDVGANESHPQGEGAADVKASDQSVPCENDSHFTHADEDGASAQDDGSKASSQVEHDAAWAAQT